MKKLITRFGGIAALIVVGAPVLSGLFIGFGRDSFASGEIIGYASMIVAMSMVFFAMKHYRDEMNNGILSFGQGFKIGLMISVVGGLAFALYNIVFVEFIMPDFNEQYFAYQSGLEIGTSEFEEQYKAMMDANGFMFSLVGGTLLMFFTVFLIGLLESIIAALIMQSKPKAVA